MAAGAFAQDFFPLQLGNQWVYRAGGRIRNSPVIVEVTATREVNGVSYFVLSGMPGAPLLVRKNDAGSLVIYDQQSREERNWVAFSAAVGEAFATSIDPCNKTAVIQSRNAKLNSPLGDFDNALRVGYAPANCADAGFTSETFLPYIGLADRRMTSIAGEVSWELIYARLGGFTVFSEKENSFSLTLDASQYRPGEALTARLTLRNTEPRALPLVFSSSQEYDLFIRNDKGEGVYTWSADKSFLQVIRQLELTGEKNWIVVGPQNLPPGRYTATATITADRKFESTVSFQVLDSPR